MKNFTTMLFVENAIIGIMLKIFEG